MGDSIRNIARYEKARRRDRKKRYRNTEVSRVKRRIIGIIREQFDHELLAFGVVNVACELHQYGAVRRAKLDDYSLTVIRQALAELVQEAELILVKGICGELRYQVPRPVVERTPEEIRETYFDKYEDPRALPARLRSRLAV